MSSKNKVLDQIEATTETNPLAGMTPEQLIAHYQQEIKSLKAAAKPKKELKGDLVRFTTKEGVEVEGKGVLYYVVRVGSKLVYREASKVTVIKPPVEEPVA